MKKIEVDDELYQYIAGQTQDIGESASQILRRLLNVSAQGEITTFERSTKSQKVVSLLDSSELSEEPKSIARFLLILSVMYQEDPNAFAIATDVIKGKTRVYFAQSKEDLRESASASKPREIPNTPYWVITNTNTGRKRIIMAQLMASIGYEHQLIERVCEQL